MEVEDGGPAFPVIETRAAEDQYFGAYSHVYSDGGMTLRDYFAAQALAYFHPVGSDAPAEVASTAIARAAYMVADAMLKERAK